MSTTAVDDFLVSLIGDNEGEWQERALCAQTDPEAFFPEKGGSTTEAKRICLGCEVRAQCLDYALSNHERFGIWGGLSERERRLLTGDGADYATTHQASAYLGISLGPGLIKRLQELGLEPVHDGPGDGVLWEWDALQELGEAA